jgi:hypothetical protein
MKYTVVWRASAEAELARIWGSSIDCQAVTTASNTIDQALRVDPILRGKTDIGHRRAHART